MEMGGKSISGNMGTTAHTTALRYGMKIRDLPLPTKSMAIDMMASK